MPRDPKRDAETAQIAMLLEAMAGREPANAIYEQERNGQADLCSKGADTHLPVEGSDDPAFAAMGVQMGPPLPNDPLFRVATLPPGWSIKPTDHSMWSDLCDDTGRKRAAIFYKAAFYDRRAFISPTAADKADGG